MLFFFIHKFSLSSHQQVIGSVPSSRSAPAKQESNQEPGAESNKNGSAGIVLNSVPQFCVSLLQIKIPHAFSGIMQPFGSLATVRAESASFLGFTKRTGCALKFLCNAFFY
jgi:hypothetical protein